MSLLVMMNSNNGYVAANFARKLITVGATTIQYSVKCYHFVNLFRQSNASDTIMFRHPGKIETTYVILYIDRYTVYLQLMYNKNITYNIYVYSTTQLTFP